MKKFCLALFTLLLMGVYLNVNAAVDNDYAKKVEGKMKEIGSYYVGDFYNCADYDESGKVTCLESKQILKNVLNSLSVSVSTIDDDNILLITGFSGSDVYFAPFKILNNILVFEGMEFNITVCDLAFIVVGAIGELNGYDMDSWVNNYLERSQFKRDLTLEYNGFEKVDKGFKIDINKLSNKESYSEYLEKRLSENMMYFVYYGEDDIHLRNINNLFKNATFSNDFYGGQIQLGSLYSIYSIHDSVLYSEINSNNDVITYLKLLLLSVSKLNSNYMDNFISVTEDMSSLLSKINDYETQGFSYDEITKKVKIDLSKFNLGSYLNDANKGNIENPQTGAFASSGIVLCFILGAIVILTIKNKQKFYKL